MPIENWYPINAANHDLPASNDGWTLGAGASKNVATRPGGGRLGPITHDDATSYITINTSVRLQALNVDWPGPIAALGAVFNANVRWKATGGGATNRNQRFVNAAATEGGQFNVVSDASLNYFNSGPADVSAGATYKPGGTAWAVSDFLDDKTIFAQVQMTSGGPNSTEVTSIWGQFEYTPPAGGFAFLLGIAGLLPALGALTDFAHFRSYLAWRRRYHPRHTILTGAEVEQAWREIRAYRHPTFFLPRCA